MFYVVGNRQSQLRAQAQAEIAASDPSESLADLADDRASLEASFSVKQSEDDSLELQLRELGLNDEDIEHVMLECSLHGCLPHYRVRPWFRHGWRNDDATTYDEKRWSSFRS